MIEFRAQLDKSYVARNLGNTFVDSDLIGTFEESVICTYVDLDQLIETTKLTINERLILRYLMFGYKYCDLQDVIGYPANRIKTMAKRMYRDLYDEYKYQKEEFLHINGFVKIKDEERFKQCGICGKWLKICNKNFTPNEDGKDGYYSICKKCKRDSGKI